MAKKTESTFTTVISTGLIALLTYTDFVPNEFEDFSKMAVPIVSQMIVIFLIWFFMVTNLNTIEELKKNKIRTKLKTEIEQDITALEKAIRSGLLSEEDTNKKKKELSNKYEELTNIKVKI